MKKSLFSLFLTGSLALSAGLPLNVLAARQEANKTIKKAILTDVDFFAQEAKKPFRKRLNSDVKIYTALDIAATILLYANAVRLGINKKPIYSAISAALATLSAADTIVGAYMLYTQPKIPKRLIEPKPNKPIAIAKPFPGELLQLDGIPQRPGFYHMVSTAPVPEKDGYCAIHALYNIGLTNEKVLGKRPSDKEFFAAQKAVVKNPAHRTGLIRIFLRSGLNIFDISKIIKRLKLPITTLRAVDNNIICEDSWGFYSTDLGEIAEAFIKINKLAREWHNSTGPRVAHFLCYIPGHAFAISVIRMADGSQAMYLYDGLNEQADDIPLMRQHIEYIYDRFF